MTKQTALAGAGTFLLAAGLVLVLAARGDAGDPEPIEPVPVEMRLVLSETDRDTVMEGLTQAEDALRALEVRNYRDARDHMQRARNTLAALLASRQPEEEN